MMSIAVFSRLLLAYMLFPCSALAGWLSAQTVAVVPQAVAEPNVTLTGYMAEVQNTLQSLDSMPHCRRIAHKNLISLCATYDKHGQTAYENTDAAVETFRDLFAIQMTGCDMEGAQQEMPAACQPLLQLDHRSMSSDLRLATTHCKEALFDGNNNYWTSFKSNGDSGRVVCYAMRSEIDKEEQLQNLWKMLEAVNLMGHVMKDQSTNMEGLKKASEALSAELRNAFEGIQIEHEQLKADFKRSFGEVARDISNMGAGVNDLLSSVRQVDTGLQRHSAYFEEIVGRVASLTTDVDTWNSGVEKFRDDFEELQAKMQLESQQVLQEVFKKLYEFTADVTTVNEVVSSLAGQFDVINTGMEDSLSKIQAINIVAGEAHDTVGTFKKQLQGMESQANDTRESMEIINGHVAQMQTWATTASTALHGFNSIFESLKHFAGVCAFVTCIMVLVWCFTGMNWRQALVISSCLYAIVYMLSTLLTSLKTAAGKYEAICQDGVEIPWRIVFCSLGAGLLIGAGTKILFDKLREPSTTTAAPRDVEYDPASPKYPVSPQYPVIAEKYRI